MLNNILLDNFYKCPFAAFSPNGLKTFEIKPKHNDELNTLKNVWKEIDNKYDQMEILSLKLLLIPQGFKICNFGNLCVVLYYLDKLCFSFESVIISLKPLFLSNVLI